MTTTINASTSNGLVQSADGSGIIKLQSNGVTTNALAWVNFNGTGTVAIRSSYNVSSITDNGTGNYTVNFATALSDSNYVVSLAEVGTTIVPSTSTNPSFIDVASYSASNLTVRTFEFIGSGNDTLAEDIESVFVTVHGN